MTEIRALIEQLVAAGVDPIEAAEVVSRAAIHGAANSAPARTARQERNARYYAAKASEKRLKASEQDVSDGGHSLSSPEGSSPKPLSPRPLQSIPPSPPKGGSSPAEFDEFWDLYPNKTGKAAARPKFDKARKVASFEAIMAGLRVYATKTDDRPWCNPTTWLHQERWADEPQHAARGSPPPSKAPSQAEVFAFIARNCPDDPGPEYDDSRGARQAIPHLR
jgi:hypothetical protein